MRSSTPRLILLSLLGAACASAGFAQDAKLSDESAVARVDKRPVTRKALYSHLLRYYGRGAVEQLVNRSVLEQEAKRLKVTVTDADLTARVAAVVKALGERYPGILQDEGISEAAWRERLRLELLAEKVLAAKWPVKNDDLVRLSVRYIRLNSQREARQVIQEARSGVSFLLLSKQRSLDKENDGMVVPDPFLRVENPGFFKMAWDAGLRAGQMTPAPVANGEFWYVLRLEKRLDPDTLQPQQRQDLAKRVTQYRMGFLLPYSRRRYTVEYPTATAALLSDPSAGRGAVVAKVGAESISGKTLLTYLVTYFARPALETLVDRGFISLEAGQLNLSVSDSEVDARVEEFKRSVGESVFRTALSKEGITEETWRERVRYTLLAEKEVNTRFPPADEELVRMSAKFIRLPGQQQAAEVIRLAASGAEFDQLIARSPASKGFGGAVRPPRFLAAEQPEIFKAIADAKLEPGQVLPRPLQTAGGAFLVLKLEARFGPETLTTAERTAAIRKINARRMGELLDRIRKSHQIEYVVPLAALVADAQA
jgi:parvulin-like peptidyl-prolyl isomerase